MGGKKRIPIEEIEKRIFDAWGDVVSLKEETYISTNKKCTFVDKDYGEFRAIPGHVFNGHGHRNRGYAIVSQKLSSSKITKTLFEVNPDLAKEWIAERNLPLTPQTTAFSSGKKVWWRCNKKGHEWKSTVSNRTKHGNGCPGCSGRAVTEINSVQNSSITVTRDWNLEQNNLRPHEVAKGSHELFHFMCHVCQYKWRASANNRTKPGGSNCPKCVTEQTRLEVFAGDLFNLPKFNEIILEKRNYRPDFKITDSIFIGVHGLWPHGERRKPYAKYHFEMRGAFEQENKRIIQFYEDEIYNKSPIVKSIVENAFGKINNKIMARKCNVVNIEFIKARLFFEQNHLMSGVNGISNIGLVYEEELVSCMGYKLLKDNKGINYIKIERFCSKINTVIPGGFQKLIAALEDIAMMEGALYIKSFCDLRYGTGNSYEKAGFKRTGISAGFEWTNGKRRFNRHYCVSTVKINGKSEKDNALIKKVYRIYNAGQARYVKFL